MGIETDALCVSAMGKTAVRTVLENSCRTDTTIQTVAHLWQTPWRRCYSELSLALLSHPHHRPAPDAIQPAALGCSARHLAVSALQTHLESLSPPPVFWFLMLDSQLSLLQLSLLFFLVPTSTADTSLILALLLTSLLCFPSNLVFFCLTGLLTFAQILATSFFHLILGFCLLGMTHFDHKTGSDSPDFTWHQPQTWQIDVHTWCSHPSTQLPTVIHTSRCSEWDCVRWVPKTHSESRYSLRQRFQKTSGER